MPVAIIIPVGPYHNDIAPRAIASALAQTVPHELQIVYDEKGRGPSWARNAGARRLQYEVNHLVFLDADDEIAPTFIAECLAATKPKTYIYTDWRMGNRTVTAPDAGATYCFCPRPISSASPIFHPVTSLIPRQWFDRVGGFDESLKRGGEDKALFTALNMSGCCGVPLHKPLFTYHSTPNSRGDKWGANTKAARALHHKLFKQFGGIMSGCRTCGGSRRASGAASFTGGAIGVKGAQINHRKRGGATILVTTSVKAQFMSATERSPTGRVTQFNYDVYYKRQLVYPDVIWIDPRDAEASPDSWAIIEDAPAPEAVADGPDHAMLIEAGQQAIANGGIFK